VDGRAESGQRGCDRLADSRRRAGDDHPLPGHGLRAWAWGPPQSAHPRTKSAIAQQDRPVEHAIKNRRDSHREL